jgi:hypothetical protein
MTWQRIDEDAYIDDTLVICAEYQLFIDEMREQGQYYQPDHWTSYQFPEGRSREPVLGVRNSDAVTFCEWLAKRDAGVWRFRLPNYREARQHTILSTNDLLLGSWLVEQDGEMQFFLIKGNLSDPAIGESVTPLSLDIECNRVAMTIDNLIRNGSKYYYNSKNANDLVFDLKSIINRTFDRSGWTSINTLISRVLKLARSLKSINTYELTIDILKWQDRILSRSPAFEGIRLVKERIS